MQIPRQVGSMLVALESAGYEAYLVGGCVRDALLGLEPKDYDITSSALPEQAALVLQRFGCRVHPTGIEHGTVTAVLDGCSVEITAYRADGIYRDNRHPSCVRFVSSIREDLLRRDFTVNAMAFHPKRGIVDIVGGERDLRARMLRCVGEPDRRFAEDALRILRALRFASVLDFSIEETTAKAIHGKAALLQNVAKERIATELLQCLCGKNAREILLEYGDVVRTCLPGFHCVSHGEYHAAVCRLSELPAESMLRLGALLAACGEKKNAICSMRLSAEQKRTVETLLFARDSQLDTLQGVRKAVCRYGEGTARLLLLYHGRQTDLLEKIKSENLCCSIKQLNIGGNDLKRMGFSGRQIGRILDVLLNEVMEEKLSNETETLHMAAERMRENGCCH